MLYLGKNGVVHRGIRSSRVLISGNGRVQLADFRLSGAFILSNCLSCFSSLTPLSGTILDRLLHPGVDSRSHSLNRSFHNMFYLRQ
jgi:serine/threonine protein kinase